VIYDALLFSLEYFRTGRSFLQFLLPNQHKDKAFTLALHKTLNLPDCRLLLGLYVCLIQSEFDKCSTLTIYDDRIVFLNVLFSVKLLLNCFPNLKLYMI